MTTTRKERLVTTSLDWTLAGFLFLLSLGLYIRTLAPGVLPGDSAEFQVLAHQLGIAHCPGYPIYLLLAKLFTLLPFGEIAYRVNLFSAFMAALTVVGPVPGRPVTAPERWASFVRSPGHGCILHLLDPGCDRRGLYGRRGFLFMDPGLRSGLAEYRENQVPVHGRLVGRLEPGDSHHGFGPGSRDPAVHVVEPERGCGCLAVCCELGLWLGPCCGLRAFYALDRHYPPANIFNGGL